MGIVVCICMLLGLVALRPTPWSARASVNLDSRLRLSIAILLLILGLWNTLYGFFNIDGFWFWASIASGITMLAASIFVFSEQQSPANSGRLRSAVIALLSIGFLLYFITLVQLNLGYKILS